MKNNSHEVFVSPGVWPSPGCTSGFLTTYRLELSESTFEARLRIYKGAIKTAAYLLIPIGGERPDNVPVAAWIKAQSFYNTLSF